MSNELIPSQQEIQTIQVIAKNAVASNYFKNLGGEQGLLMIMLYARDLGIPLTQAVFGGMYNVNGKITLSSSLMNNMIRKAGHKMEIVKSDSEGCTIIGTRKDTGDKCECSFTMKEATELGLTSNQTWKKYPSDMCFARCLSRLARRLFADVIGNAYVEGELDKESTGNQKEPVKMEVTDIQIGSPNAVLNEQTGELLEVQPEIRYITEKQRNLWFHYFKEWPAYKEIVEKRCDGSVAKMPFNEMQRNLDHFNAWIANEQRKQATQSKPEIKAEEPKDDDCPF